MVLEYHPLKHYYRRCLMMSPLQFFLCTLDMICMMSFYTCKSQATSSCFSKRTTFREQPDSPWQRGFPRPPKQVTIITPSPAPLERRQRSSRHKGSGRSVSGSNMRRSDVNGYQNEGWRIPDLRHDLDDMDASVSDDFFHIVLQGKEHISLRPQYHFGLRHLRITIPETHMNFLRGED